MRVGMRYDTGEDTYHTGITIYVVKIIFKLGH